MGTEMVQVVRGGSVELNPIKVLFVEADAKQELNCSIWRCRMPAAALDRHIEWGVVAELVHLEDYVTGKVNELVEWADLVFLQRGVTPECNQVTCYLKSRKKKVIVDLDDAYQYMPSCLNGYAFWHQGLKVDWFTDAHTLSNKTNDMKKGPVLYQTFENIKKTRLGYMPLEHLSVALKLADAVSSPSRLILEDHALLQPKGVYLPNMFDIPLYPIRPGWNRKELPVVGWGGSAGHVETFRNSNVLPALRRLVVSNFITLKLVGPESISNEARFSHEYHPAVEFAAWPEMERGFDIGIAPLDGSYDRRRSYIKGVEYALQGIPWVGTKSAPYERFAESKGCILVSNSAQRWQDAIIEIRNNYEAYYQALLDERDALVQSVDAEVQGQYWAGQLREVAYGLFGRD